MSYICLGGDIYICRQYILWNGAIQISNYLYLYEKWFGRMAALYPAFHSPDGICKM